MTSCHDLSFSFCCVNIAFHPGVHASLENISGTREQPIGYSQFALAPVHVRGYLWPLHPGPPHTRACIIIITLRRQNITSIPFHSNAFPLDVVSLFLSPLWVSDINFHAARSSHPALPYDDDDADNDWGLGLDFAFSPGRPMAH